MALRVFALFTLLIVQPIMGVGCDRAEPAEQSGRSGPGGGPAGGSGGSSARATVGTDRSGVTPTSASAVEPIEVEVAPVVRGALGRTLDVTGTLYGNEEATISAKVAGRIVALNVDVGDIVEPGAVLAQIETTEFELTLEQRRTAMLEALAALGLEALPDQSFDPESVPTVQRARLEAANAEARFGRAAQLWAEDPPLISEQDHADLKTAWEVAKSNADVALLEVRARLAEARSRAADLALMQQRLDDTVVRAPVMQGLHDVPGVRGMQERSGAEESARSKPLVHLRYAAAARFVSIGEYVREATPLFRLVAADPIKFRAEVPERALSEVAVGQEIALRVESWREPFKPSLPFMGRITRISPQVNIASRTFQIEAELRNAEQRLRPGAFGRATIALGVDEGALLVPTTAISTFAGVTRVYSIADGVVVEHLITLGRRRDGLVEAIGAPPTLDHVITSSLSRLAAGVPVREK